jgi:hypothetical protein
VQIVRDEADPFWVKIEKIPLDYPKSIDKSSNFQRVTKQRRTIDFRGQT